MSNIVKTEGQKIEMSLFDPNYLATLEAISKRFANSEMVPDFYKAGAVLKKGQPPQTAEKAEANCFIAINMAMRLKADPLMVMQNMKPIMGSPTLSAQFIIALINNSGIYDDLEFDFVNKGPISNVKYTDYEWDQRAGGKIAKEMVFAGPVDNWTCTCKTRKVGTTKDIVGPEVSIEMAIKELWYTKAGSKWPNMTELMLTYRAATFWKSTHAPHITMGLPSTEEIVDSRNIEEGEFTELSSKIKGATEGRKTVKVEPVAKTEPTTEENTVVEPVQEKEQEPAPAKDETPAYANDDLDKVPEAEEEEDDDDDIARIEH